MSSRAPAKAQKMAQGEDMIGKPSLSQQQIEHARKLRQQSESPAAIAELLKCSRATVYRALAG